MVLLKTTKSPSTPSYTSLSEYHTTLVQMKHSVVSTNFIRGWDKGNILTCLNQTKFITGKENGVVQELWTDMVGNINKECHKEVYFVDSHKIRTAIKDRVPE